MRHSFQAYAFEVTLHLPFTCCVSRSLDGLEIVRNLPCNVSADPQVNFTLAAIVRDAQPCRRQLQVAMDEPLPPAWLK